MEKGNFELSELWPMLRSKIYRVFEHDGDDAVNVAGAQVRHFCGDLWLYVDDSDGYLLLRDDEMEHLSVGPDDDERRFNYWDVQGNVIR